MEENPTVDDVIVAGGGDAGKLGALILKEKNPTLDIRIIDDMAEPPREVGKSTFSSITWILHEQLDIDIREFVEEVNPVWKHCVYLEDWTGSEFFTPFDLKSLMDKQEKSLESVNYRYRTDNFTSVNEEATYQRKTPFIETSERLTSRHFYPHVAYHLNVYKFDQYLHELLDRRGIEVIDDAISSVNTDGQFITSIESDRRSYEADLYVDTTGFQRILASELPVSFNEYDFGLDSALVTQVPISLGDVVPATVVRTLSNGWTWQIDTTDSRDLGYVYSSEYTTREDARHEFRDEYDIPESADISHFEFSAGTYDRAWVGNCLIAGDAYGFVEPLQATSLSTHAHAMCDIADQLSENSRVMYDGVRHIVNNLLRTYWDEIYDFLTLFYRYASDETEFWEDMQTVGDDDEWDQYENMYRDGAAFVVSKAKWTNDSMSFGKVFNVHQADYTLYHLGVPIDIHESDDVAVTKEVKAQIDRKTEKVEETVDAFLTYPEIYSKEYFGEPRTLVEEERKDKRSNLET